MCVCCADLTSVRAASRCAASAVIINSDGENFIYTSPPRPSSLRPAGARRRPAQAGRGEAGNALSTMPSAIKLPTAAAYARSCTLSFSSRMAVRVLSSRSGL